MRRIVRSVVVFAVAGAGVLAATPAQAADSNADFGQHVSTCARTMGFNSAHNPGVHHGKTGWMPTSTCPM